MHVVKMTDFCEWKKNNQNKMHESARFFFSTLNINLAICTYFSQNCSNKQPWLMVLFDFSIW